MLAVTFLFVEGLKEKISHRLAPYVYLHFQEHLDACLAATGQCFGKEEGDVEGATYDKYLFSTNNQKICEHKYLIIKSWFLSKLVLQWHECAQAPSFSLG